MFHAFLIMIFFKERAVMNRRLFHIVVISILVISVLAIVLSSGSRYQAKEYDPAVKQYTSILLKPGDTLWGIASEYSDGHYESIYEYIDEVKFINNLSSDTIISNEYLLIPYYIG